MKNFISLKQYDAGPKLHLSETFIGQQQPSMLSFNLYYTPSRKVWNKSLSKDHIKWATKLLVTVLLESNICVHTSTV